MVYFVEILVHFVVKCFNISIVNCFITQLSFVRSGISILGKPITNNPGNITLPGLFVIKI